MKKIGYFSIILIVLIQYLIPLPAVAETLRNSTLDGLSLDSAEIHSINQDQEETKTIEVTLKGAYTSSENSTDASYEIKSSDNVHIQSDQQVTFLSSTGDSLGQAVVVNEHTLRISGLTQANAAFNLQFQATVNKQEGLTQEISFRDSYENKITESIQFTEESTQPTADSTVTSETSSSVETKESTTLSSDNNVITKKQARRAAVDISTLFPTEDGQESMVTAFDIQNEDGQPIESMTIDEYIQFYFGFDMPESVREQMQGGDYYEFDLPSAFSFTQNKNIPLTDEDGITYANVEIGVNGHVKIVFTDDVANASNINGSFSAGGKANEKNIPGPGPIDVDTPFVDGDTGKEIDSYVNNVDKSIRLIY
ncbi:Ig-like domain-containing protein [Enterococcus faecalis]